MELSRYTFLMGAFSALTLAGCGGGGGGDTPSTPTVYDPVPEYSDYTSREVVPSPDKKFEAIIYSGYLSPRISYREYGNQDTAILEQFPNGEEGNTSKVYLGNKEALFWSPRGDKLYMMLTSWSGPSPGTKTVLKLVEPRLVTSTVRTYVEIKETSFVTEVLAAYDTSNFPDNRTTLIDLYPTGFSADGTLLLYSSVVSTSQGRVTTKYAFDYRTNTNMEVSS